MISPAIMKKGMASRGTLSQPLTNFWARANTDQAVGRLMAWVSIMKKPVPTRE